MATHYNRTEKAYNSDAIVHLLPLTLRFRTDLLKFRYITLN